MFVVLCWSLVVVLHVSGDSIGIEEEPCPVPAKYVSQPQDHLDPSNTNTWNQRWYVNDTYWNGRGPVLLCVGGETPLTGCSVYASYHCNDAVELAPQVSGLLLGLEHRFYGGSLPTGKNFSNHNLRLLTSEQALADLANFHTYATKYFKMSPTQRWVSFGGSYPGMLSAWSRLKYPHLIHASVASSAPVFAQVDFQGYNDVVGASIATELVGGSDDCAAFIKKGHQQVGELLQSATGQAQLATQFNLCNKSALSEKYNQIAFASSGVASFNVQGNDPACTESVCNINKTCAYLLGTNRTGHWKELDALVDLYTLQHSMAKPKTTHSNKTGSHESCQDVDWRQYVTTLSNSSNVDRAWYWQTCNEFAFFQTCEASTGCLFTQGLGYLNRVFELRCKDAYQLGSAHVYSRVSYSNQWYGGRSPTGSRVLWVNGQIDPWHSLSVLAPPASSQPTLWVPGASHHFWTHVAKPTDSPYVKNARKAIWKQVKEWLEE